MQLKRPPSPLHLGLMAASCALLSGTARAQSADDAEQPLQIDADLLYYKENAGRVQTIEPVVSLKKDFGDQRLLDGTLTLDSLSGATPNGAIPARTPQTFASPSSTSLIPEPGHKTTLYTIAPGDLPQDPHFKEQRVAGDLDWSQPIGLAVLVRISWRLRHSAPGAIATEPRWLRLGARMTHGTLYVLLLIVPLLGWAAASARGWQVSLLPRLILPALLPRGSKSGFLAGDVHAFLAYALLAIVALHIAAALYHRIILHDQVLARMLPRKASTLGTPDST